MASSSNIIKENKESEVAILSILDEAYYNRNIKENNIEIPSKLLSSTENQENNQSNNITLFNALYNSLINKDHKSFLFCIQQKNEILIEETVKKMNSDCLTKFLEKSVDIFQSNSFYSKLIIPWFKYIMKNKKLEIFRKKNIENLMKIQIYIKNKIKCFDALCILKEKINKINNMFCENKKDNNNYIINEDKNKDEINDNNKPIIFEPLLTYYESEDENETKKNKIKKDKMEIEGFEEIEKEEKEEEIEDNINSGNEKEESEEDDLDEEIDNMFMDDNEKIKSKKNEKKNDNMDGGDDDEEENEDNIEEEDDL